MNELSLQEIEIVSGGAISKDAAYGAALGGAAALLGLGLVVTAPAWMPAMLVGGSIACSMMAVHYARPD